jgi:hypothetical protein
MLKKGEKFLDMNAKYTGLNYICNSEYAVEALCVGCHNSAVIQLLQKWRCNLL